MKVTFFNSFYLPHLGGVEVYTEKLARELKKLGHEITIVTTNHDNLPSYEKGEFTIYRLPTHDVLRQRLPFLKKNADYRKIVKKIESEDADIFICNTRYYSTTLLGLKLAKKKGGRSLVIEHGSGHIPLGVSVLDQLWKIYEHSMTHRIKKYKNAEFYGVSQRCNKWLKHFGVKSSGVFYNSVDIGERNKHKDKKYPLKEDGIKLLFAGRILKEKGIIILLDAFKKIIELQKDVVLYVAGDGNMLPDARRIYENEQIIFLGRLDHDELMTLYNAVDIFVHPSMYPEGLPTAIEEAGIMKCAVVATDRGGTIEVINSDELGLIVLENEQDLYDKLKYLIEHPQAMEKMGNKLYNRISREFSWEKTAKTVDKVIRRISE